MLYKVPQICKALHNMFKTKLLPPTVWQLSHLFHLEEYWIISLATKEKPLVSTHKAGKINIATSAISINFLPDIESDATTLN